MSEGRMLDGTPIHDPSKVEQKECGCSLFEYCRKCRPEAFEETDQRATEVVDLTDAQKRLLETYHADREWDRLESLREVLLELQDRLEGIALSHVHFASKSDPVNHPAHYTQGSIECIDAIEAMLGAAKVSFLRGSAIKYLWRMEHKESALEDAKKAQFYVNRLVEVLSEPSRT